MIQVWRTPTLKTMRFASGWVLFVFYPETKWRSQRHLLIRFQTIFSIMGCHAGGTPIVNGVKKTRRTPLRGESEQKINTKSGGEGRGGGVDVSIRHSTPPPLANKCNTPKSNFSHGIQLFLPTRVPDVFCFSVIICCFETEKEKKRSYIPSRA